MFGVRMRDDVIVSGCGMSLSEAQTATWEFENFEFFTLSVWTRAELVTF